MNNRYKGVRYKVMDAVTPALRKDMESLVLGMLEVKKEAMGFFEIEKWFLQNSKYMRSFSENGLSEFIDELGLDIVFRCTLEKVLYGSEKLTFETPFFVKGDYEVYFRRKK
jgi:hypothetical protein